MGEPGTAGDLAARLAHVRERICHAADRAGRDPASITLIGVSKGQPHDIVASAVRLGLRDLGENRVQEGTAKAEALAAEDLHPRWHLIGHLQRNKAAPALAAFPVIHSIDSAALLDRIGRLAKSPVEALIEVNVAGEASKHGVAPGEVEALVRAAEEQPMVRLRGLMTVAPQYDDPEDARPVFRELAAIAHHYALSELSMGMTDDFEVAIEEGATLVRVGRAIFGERH